MDKLLQKIFLYYLLIIIFSSIVVIGPSMELGFRETVGWASMITLVIIAVLNIWFALILYEEAKKAGASKLWGILGLLIGGYAALIYYFWVIKKGNEQLGRHKALPAAQELEPSKAAPGPAGIIAKTAPAANPKMPPAMPGAQPEMAKPPENPAAEPEQAEPSVKEFSQPNMGYPLYTPPEIPLEKEKLEPKGIGVYPTARPPTPQDGQAETEVRMPGNETVFTPKWGAALEKDVPAPQAKPDAAMDPLGEKIGRAVAMARDARKSGVQEGEIRAMLSQAGFSEREIAEVIGQM